MANDYSLSDNLASKLIWNHKPMPGSNVKRFMNQTYSLVLIIISRDRQIKLLFGLRSWLICQSMSEIMIKDRLRPMYSWYPPMYSWHPTDVLNIPWCTHDIPRCTEHTSRVGKFDVLTEPNTSSKRVLPKNPFQLRWKSSAKTKDLLSLGIGKEKFLSIFCYWNLSLKCQSKIHLFLHD